MPANVMRYALFLSEFGLIHTRVTVEVRWLQALSNRPKLLKLLLSQLKQMQH